MADQLLKAVPKPSKFNPEKQTFSQWLEEFNTYCELVNITDKATKLKFIPSFLDYDSVHFVNRIPATQKDSYDKLVQLLKDNLEVKDHQQKLKCAFLEITRRKDETLFQLYLRIVDASEKAFSDLAPDACQNMEKHQFIAALDPEMQRHVLLQNPATTAQAREAADRWEQVNRATTSKSGFSTPKVHGVQNTATALDSQVSQLQQQISDLEQELAVFMTNRQQFQSSGPQPLNTNPRRNVRCFGCGKYGHYRRDCRSLQSRPIVCNTCGGKGHKSTVCPSKTSNKNQKPTDGKVNSIAEDQRAPTFKPYIYIWVKDVKVLALIDSGAALSVVSQKLIQRLNIPQDHVKPVDQALTSVSGESLTVPGRTKITWKWFKNQQKSQSASFHIVENLSEEIIIGWDLIARDQLSFDYTEQQLRAGKITIPLLRVTQLNKIGHRVCIAKLESIPPRSQKIVWCQVEDDHLSKVRTYEAVVIGKNQQPYTIPDALVRVSRSTLPIQVINESEEELCLSAGTEVATIDKLDEEELDTSKLMLEDCEYPGALFDNLEHLSAEHQTRLRDVVNARQSAFKQHKYDLGRTHLVEQQILTGEHPPIKQKYRRTPVPLQEKIDKELEVMLKTGVIHRSVSPWSSPIVPVRKKDGSIRICVDYRLLNACTVPDATPLPRPEDILDAMAGNKLFSTLDVSSCFWQLPLREEDQCKTAFTCHQGLFEWSVVPFGLRNSPQACMQCMKTLLDGINPSRCQVFVDDVVLASTTFEEHIELLDEVLERFQNANLKLNPQKCKLVQLQVTYLGHQISAAGIAPNVENVEKIKNFPVPATVKQTRSFLGLTGYYRKFIKNYAKIAKPLFELTKKDQSFSWTEERQKAFDILRTALISYPIMRAPDFSKEFIVCVDSSGVAIGAVLSQKDDQGKEYVIAYFSKTLSREQQVWSVFDKEFFGIISAVRHFSSYLTQCRCVIYTDHKPLATMDRIRTEGDWSAKRQRWLIELSTYNYELLYKPGKIHNNADTLSRIPDNRAVSTVVSALTMAPTNQSWKDQCWDIKHEQKKDPVCRHLMEIIEGRDPTPWDWTEQQAKEVRYLADLQNKSKLLQKDSVLTMKSRTGNLLFYAPKHFRGVLLQITHDSALGGHLGVAKTTAALQQKTFWATLKEDVKNWVASCEKCQRRKNPVPHQQAPLMPMSTTKPLEMIAMDILKLPRTRQGNQYLLVIIDMFSRHSMAYPLKTQTAKEVSTIVFDHYIPAFGIPGRILTDLGLSFEGKLMKRMCKMLGIKKVHTTAFHPQGDGLCERQNRTLMDILAKYVGKNADNWDGHLGHVISAYNSAVHSSTGYSPYLLMFGRPPITGLTFLGLTEEEELIGGETDYLQETRRVLMEAEHLASRRQDQAKTAQKRQYDKKQRFEPYKVGDQVYLYQPAKLTGGRRKLASVWEGPFRVLKVLNHGVNYVIDKGGREVNVHYNRLKPCVKRSKVWNSVSDSSENPSISSESELEDVAHDFLQQRFPPEPEEDSDIDIVDTEVPQRPEIVVESSEDSEEEIGSPETAPPVKAEGAMEETAGPSGYQTQENQPQQNEESGSDEYESVESASSNETGVEAEQQYEEVVPVPPGTRTKSGRQVKPPSRYNDYVSEVGVKKKSSRSSHKLKDGCVAILRDRAPGKVKCKTVETGLVKSKVKSKVSRKLKNSSSQILWKLKDSSSVNVESKLGKPNGKGTQGKSSSRVRDQPEAQLGSNSRESDFVEGDKALVGEVFCNIFRLMENRK